MISLFILSFTLQPLVAGADDQCQGGGAQTPNLGTQTQQTQAGGSQGSTSAAGAALQPISAGSQSTIPIGTQDPLIEGLDNVVTVGGGHSLPGPGFPIADKPTPAPQTDVVSGANLPQHRDDHSSRQSYFEEKEKEHREAAARWREDARKERELADSWWEWFCGFHDHHLRMANKWDDEARKEELKADMSRAGIVS